MKKIIDIHSHILPNVDDGCETKEEAKEMLAQYEEQNVEAVICTPHFGPCAMPHAEVNKAYDWIRNINSPVSLYLGNEILMANSTIRDLYRGKARTLAGTNWVLLEFENWYYCTPGDTMLACCKAISELGYSPIVAHPERYESLQENPDMCKAIADCAKLQVNAYDIYSNPKTQITRTSQSLLTNGLVSFIGSDAHGSKRRAPALSTGVQWIYDHCPTEYADAVVHDNAAKIIREGA